MLLWIDRQILFGQFEEQHAAHPKHLNAPLKKSKFVLNDRLLNSNIVVMLFLAYLLLFNQGQKFIGSKTIFPLGRGVEVN